MPLCLHLTYLEILTLLDEILLSFPVTGSTAHKYYFAIKYKFSQLTCVLLKCVESLIMQRVSPTLPTYLELR